VSKWTEEQLAERDRLYARLRRRGGLSEKAVQWLEGVIEDALKAQKAGTADGRMYPAEMHMRAVIEVMNRGGLPVMNQMEFSGESIPVTLISYEKAPEEWRKAPEVTAH
jgi:hypothetical protein